MAIVLLALAIPLGVWVLAIVNDTIHDTKAPAILQKLCPDGAKQIDIDTPSGKVVLPPQLFPILSYMVLVFLLMIPTSIAMVLLKGSISLLRPDLTYQIRRLIDSIAKSAAPKQ
jgi:hypothetical protein